MDLEGKTWEELCVMAFDSFNKRKKLISKAIEELEDLDSDIEMHTDEIAGYLQTLQSGVHIPRWNVYPNTTPASLEIHVEFYYVYLKDGCFFMEARWTKNGFETRNEYRDSGNLFELDDNVNYWLPITYPTPY
jgi:hypothetical protein